MTISTSTPTRRVRPARFLVFFVALGLCAAAAFGLAPAVQADDKPPADTPSAQADDKDDKPEKREKPRRRTILHRLTFDPDAPRVGMFEAMKSGDVDIQVVPHDQKGGYVLIENVSAKPLTIELPKSIVGVHVLHQLPGMGMGGMGMGGMGMGGMGMGGMGGGMGGMGGMSQMMGGGMGGMGMGGGMGGMGMGGGMGGMGGGMGGGFFSIPPEKTAKIPYHSICLEHGKPSPTPRMTYQLFPPEDVVEDPNLLELIDTYAAGRVRYEAAQAAAWHIADKMTWQQLAAKRVRREVNRPPVPYFKPADLWAAHSLVAQVVAKARQREQTQPKPEIRSPGEGIRSPGERVTRVSGN